MFPSNTSNILLKRSITLSVPKSCPLSKVSSFFHSRGALNLFDFSSIKAEGYLFATPPPMVTHIHRKVNFDTKEQFLFSLFRLLIINLHLIDNMEEDVRLQIFIISQRTKHLHR